VANAGPALEKAERLFSGNMLGVSLERWGGADKEIVERSDSVAVVALDDDERIVLVRQFRAPTRSSLLELPAGTVGEDEDPLETARRELAEETGLRDGRWKRGPVFYTSPGFLRERIHLFFAEELRPGEASPDAGEELELVRWSADVIRARLDDIEDGKTLVGLLLYLDEQARRR
jgi:ADP-ribose pyrophosphatase